MKKALSLFLVFVMLCGIVPMTVFAAEEAEANPYKGKVISILGDSISTFAGYIPTADGFNLEHLARYPQDNLLTDVNETWWMQVITHLDAKLGINDSWRGATASGAHAVTTGSTGENASMANLTRIQNLGSNGTPDVILFYGGTNDLAHVSKVGSFDPDTAPATVDLTTRKWDNLADGYVNTILRLQHYYPDAQIVCLLPTYTTSYYSDEKLAQGNKVLSKICEHYGVAYTDLRECGITINHLPDGIHPDATGMDYITTAVLDVLTEQCNIESGVNKVYSVTHNLSNVYASLGHYKGISAGEAFVESIVGDNVKVTVTMGGIDITDTCYTDGQISIGAVSGDLVVTAAAEFSLGDRLQQLPDFHYGVNLWPLMRHDTDYYTVNGWGSHSSGKVRSVTIPVAEGERIYASSFEAATKNGSTTNGIRVTFFSENGMLLSIGAAEVYTEFSQNGYIRVPANANAVSIPMWTDDSKWELYIWERSDVITGVHTEYLQTLPDTFCSKTNLWSVLEHNQKYYTENGWDMHATGKVRSITIPICPGDQLWATSFQASGVNGGTMNGIRLTWFEETNVLESVSPDRVYREFATNGYLIAPEDAVAVNVVMWTDSDSNELYILNRDHSYENGACVQCGAIQSPVVGWNLALGEDIGMNFLVSVNEALTDQTYVNITVADGETVSYKVSEHTPDENGNYLFRVHVAAAQMTDDVKLQTFVGDEAGQICTYTVEQYAAAVLNDESLSVYHALVKEMLNYGAAAQVYFGYNPEKSIDPALYAGAGANGITEATAPEMTVSGSIDGVTFYGATLLHRSKTALRFYFTGVDMSRCRIAVGETVLQPVQKDGLWYVEIGDILPQLLNEPVTVNVGYNQEHIAISYSPMNYMVRMREKGGDSLQALLKSMYNYHLAAKAFAENV